MASQTDITAAADTSSEDEAAVYLGLYRRMRLIRRFEDHVQTLFQQSLVHGTTHLYSGEEAGAVGVASVLGDRDRVTATYRGHGAALALGVNPEALLAELLGRSTGVCAGRSGSMNVVDLEHRLIGCFSIVGGTIAAATGVGLALKRTGGVAVAFFGEGTTNQAYFAECLNFAKVYELPVLFMCENNGYGEFTPYQDVTAGAIADRPRALGIPADKIDGNDIWTVRATAAAAVERARNGEGPQFIESMTYRFVGHSRSDPGKYRVPGELDEWRLRDPLTVARTGLAERYGVSDDTLDDVDASVEDELNEVVEAAKAAPFPEPGETAREFKDG